MQIGIARSVRPACAKVSAASLNTWREGSFFKRNPAHGVRQLVTSVELLAPIK